MGSDGLKLAIAMKWLGASDVTRISKRHFAAKKTNFNNIYCNGLLNSNASLQLPGKKRNLPRKCRI